MEYKESNEVEPAIVSIDITEASNGPDANQPDASPVPDANRPPSNYKPSEDEDNAEEEPLTQANENEQ